MFQLFVSIGVNSRGLMPILLLSIEIGDSYDYVISFQQN